MSAQSVDAYLLFGRLAVKFGVLKPDGLRQSVEKQAQLIAKKKPFQVGEVAVRLKLMTTEQRQQILDAQATAPVKQEGSYFGYLALVNGFVKHKQLAEALKKQEADGKKQKLGEIFKADKLMTDGQIEGVLRAQERIRKRIARETQGKMEKAGAGSSKAVEALAKLAQFEQQFGGMVEVALDSGDDVDASGVAAPAAAEAAPADAEALPLPAPPQDIYSTMQQGEVLAADAVEAAPVEAEEDSRFAGPVPVPAGGPVLDLDADAGGDGEFDWGSSGNDDNVQVEVAPAGAGAAPATTADIQAMPTVDVEVEVAPGGAVPDLPSIDQPTTAEAAPSPSGAAAGAGAAAAISPPGGAAGQQQAKALPKGLVAADEGPRFKGRRKEQPQERVRKKSNAKTFLVGLIVSGVAIAGAYILSKILFGS